jgi:hypothetical protein
MSSTPTPANATQVSSVFVSLADQPTVSARLRPLPEGGAGGSLQIGPVTFDADSPFELLSLVDQGRRHVLSLDAALAAEVDGPDPLVVQGLSLLRQDLMRCLGLLPTGETLDISQIGHSDLEAARRFAARLDDMLAAHVLSEDPTDQVRALGLAPVAVAS